MKGIMYIIGIMDENGNLLKWKKANQKYDFNMLSHLSWLGLIKSIPTLLHGSPIFGIVSLVLHQESIYRMKVWNVLALKSETDTTFIKTTDISTIFRKGAKIRQGGVEESLYVA